MTFFAWIPSLGPDRLVSHLVAVARCYDRAVYEDALSSGIRGDDFFRRDTSGQPDKAFDGLVEAISLRSARG